MDRHGPKTKEDFKDSLVFQRDLAEMLGQEVKALRARVKELEAEKADVLCHLFDTPLSVFAGKTALEFAKEHGSEQVREAILRDQVKVLTSDRDRYKEALWICRNVLVPFSIAAQMIPPGTDDFIVGRAPEQREGPWTTKAEWMRTVEAVEKCNGVLFPYAERATEGTDGTS